MESAFSTLADWTQASLYVSLVLFCGAFLAEALRLPAGRKRAAYWLFVAAGAVHIVLLAAHLLTAGDMPPLVLLPVIVWGVISYAWGIVTLASRWGRGGRRVIPVYITWYLWALYAGAVMLRAMDARPADMIDSSLAGLALAAALARIVLNLKAR